MPAPREDKIAQESKELIEALKQAKLTELLELLSPKNDDKIQTQSPKDIFESFLKREDVNKADKSGNNTILHIASANGYKNIVESLLPKMTLEAINKVNIEGKTAFDDVVLNESFDPAYKDVAVLLIEKMDEKAACRLDTYGRTPLHWAAAFGLKDSVESLLPKMTPELINQYDTLDQTPLSYAVKIGNQDVINLFIKHEFNNTKLSAEKVPPSQIKCVVVKGPQESGGRI
jgi:ankyrin repeat protein